MTMKHHGLIDFDASDLQSSAKTESEATRRRVQVIVSVSNGKSPREVADAIGVSAMNVHRLLRAFNEDGLAGLRTFRIADVVDMRDDFDAEKLREIALASKDETVRRKLMAIISLYEGDTPSEVGRVVGVTAETIAAWRGDFNSRGLRGLHDDFEVVRQADISVGRRSEIEALTGLLEKLSGEDAVKAQAIVLSSEGMAIEAISLKLERPRSWAVSLIKTFNSGGVASVFPKVVNPVVALQVASAARPMRLPVGHSVKSLREMSAVAKSETVRQKLDQLASVYLYKSVIRASEATGIDRSKLSFLVKTLRETGIDGILNREQIDDINPDKVEAIASEYRDPQSAAKLMALARIVRGESYQDVAEDIGVTARSVRSWMQGLRKYGADYFPDERPAVPVKSAARASSSEKAVKPLQPIVAETRVNAKKPERQTSVSKRIVELVASNDATTAPLIDPGVTEGAGRIDEIPFIGPYVKSILGMMARDDSYAGRKLAAAVQSYIRHGNASAAARDFEVRETSIRAVYANLQATVEMYGEERVKIRIVEAGITPTSVKRMSANPPNGWMSKLRSIGYLAEGRSVREVSAITRVDPAKLITWTEELSDAWSTAKELAVNVRQVQPAKVANNR